MPKTEENQNEDNEQKQSQKIPDTEQQENRSRKVPDEKWWRKFDDLSPYCNTFIFYPAFYCLSIFITIIHRQEIDRKPLWMILALSRPW